MIHELETIDSALANLHRVIRNMRQISLETGISTACNHLDEAQKATQRLRGKIHEQFDYESAEDELPRE